MRKGTFSATAKYSLSIFPVTHPERWVLSSDYSVTACSCSLLTRSAYAAISIRALCLKIRGIVSNAYEASNESGRLSAKAQPSSVVTMMRSGKGCAKAMTIMTEREPSQGALATRPKLIGARVKRTEDPRLLSGRGAYTDDRKVPGLLHVAFRRSDHSHALIRSIDTAKAKRAEGVVAVFTADDMRDVAAVFATSRMKD